MNTQIEVGYMDPLQIKESDSPMLRNGRIRVRASGTAFPQRSIDNVELAQELGVDPSWIEEKCGVQLRSIASEEETTISLGAAAAAEALKSYGHAPDLLICSTCTPSLRFCPIAPSIATRLDLNGIGAFDINAACSGGLVGLTAASGYLLSGFAKRVLLVCTDTMTKHLAQEDRSTRILFADGAAALIIELDGQHGSKIRSFVMGSDGRGAAMFGAQAYCHSPEKSGSSNGHVKMDGPGMFRFAVERGSSMLGQLCQLANVSPSEISRVVIHEANTRITKALQRNFPVPFSNWIQTLAKRGNSTSVSVMLSLIECLRRNDLRNGDLVLLGAFGAGLTWAGLLLEWQDADPPAMGL
jgi:3-oxoacyl-[acyl-carrier-protein] synthase III